MQKFSLLIAISLIVFGVYAYAFKAPDSTSKSVSGDLTLFDKSIAQTTDFLELLAYKQGFYSHKTDGNYTNSLKDLKVNGLMNDMGDDVYNKISQSFIKVNVKSINAYQGYMFRFLKTENQKEYAVLAISVDPANGFNMYLDENMVIYSKQDKRWTNSKNDDYFSKTKRQIMGVTERKQINLNEWKVHFDINLQHTLKDVKESLRTVAKIQEDHKKEKQGYAEDMVQLFRFKQDVELDLMMAFTGEGHPVLAYDSYFYKFLKSKNSDKFSLLAYPEVSDNNRPLFLIDQSKKLYESRIVLPHTKIRRSTDIDLSQWLIVD